MNYLHKAVANLADGARYQMEGTDYDGLMWEEPPIWEGGKKKPTREEVEAEVARLQQEWENTEYQRLREFEYPDFKEYLDGIVKGDPTQMQAYIDKCLEIKAKYPKPD